MRLGWTDSRHHSEIARQTPVAIHCAGGYRSSIACGLLERAGYDNVINVIGGSMRGSGTAIANCDASSSGSLNQDHAVAAWS